MNSAAVDRIAKAVLYEGYMLYPYRPTSVKNQQRFNFGVVYPLAFSEAQRGTDPWITQTECLVEGGNRCRLEVRVRFLQLTERSVEQLVPSGPDPEKSHFVLVRSLRVGNQTYYSWQEAVERELSIPLTELETIGRYPVQSRFNLPASAVSETLSDSSGKPVGRVVRTEASIDGAVYVAAHAVAPDFFKIVVRVKNTTAIDDAEHVSRDYALTRSLVSTHVVMGVEEGGFVSLLDPPEAMRPLVGDCHSQGSFPVLVGEPGQRDTLLSSPIILYDYPQIAPESAGDLFDGTEIDEILSLRIMTMTDEEKQEMSESDERARHMLERTENMPAEQFMKLHGVLRGLRAVKEESR